MTERDVENFAQHLLNALREMTVEDVEDQIEVLSTAIVLAAGLDPKPIQDAINALEGEL